MDPKALVKVKSRIRLAKSAIAALEITDSSQSFMDEWYSFLIAFKGVYVILEQGAKLNNRSKNWYGSKKGERKKDPLLQYLFQARNADEHGLDFPIDVTPEIHFIGQKQPGSSKDMHIQSENMDVVIKGDWTAGMVIDGMPPPKDMKVTSLDGKPVYCSSNPAKIILISVKGRGKELYHPPTMHLGRDLIDKSPIAIAKLALAYLENFVLEAEEFIDQ